MESVFTCSILMGIVTGCRLAFHRSRMPQALGDSELTPRSASSGIELYHLGPFVLKRVHGQMRRSLASISSIKMVPNRDHFFRPAIQRIGVIFRCSNSHAMRYAVPSLGLAAATSPAVALESRIPVVQRKRPNTADAGNSSCTARRPVACPAHAFRSEAAGAFGEAGVI